MKNIIIVLVIYSFSLTGILIFKSGRFDSDIIKDMASYSLGDNWKSLTIKEIVPTWNNIHKDNKISDNEGLDIIAHKILKEFENKI